MIIGRILTQGSRRSLCEWVKSQELLGALGINNVKTEELYNTLDWLAEKQSKMEVALFKSRAQKKLSLYLYDVTSSYVEGQKNDLAQWGYNRDGKKGKKQIVIGLLMDEEGIPVSIEVFEGNTNDTQTVDSQVSKCVERFKIERVTFVGDRGMLKKPQKELLKAKEMSKKSNLIEENNGTYQDTYAWILYQMGEYQEAKKWIEKAIQNGGNKSAVILEHYADILYKLNNKEEAVHYWKKAKKLGGKSKYLEKKIKESRMYE